MIINSDILEWAANYDGEKFHAILTDPPYGWGFMGKEWDNFSPASLASKPQRESIDNKLQRERGSSMHAGEYDLSLTANHKFQEFSRNWATAVSKHLYPGAYLLSFCGPRTYHRMASGIEDAGFEVRDVISWIFGSGFPKSHDVSKAIDRAAGARGDAYIDESFLKRNPTDNTDGVFESGLKDGTDGAVRFKPATPEAKQWSGYGTALKPAHEMIIVARLPLEGTVAQNTQKYGSGALNIDGSRVGTEVRIMKGMSASKPSGARTFRDDNWVPKDVTTVAEGRWPANLVHDGSDEVVGMFPNSKDGVAGKRNAKNGEVMKTGLGPQDEFGGYGGSGSAARFFYSAKVSKRERDAGLEGFEEKDGGALEGNADMDNDRKIGANPERKVAPVRNNHPTLKPISLTTYLAKLILPPKLDRPRRLLVPFAGSGSEVIGGYLAGWDEVVGVEREKEYCEIAEARVKHWNEEGGKHRQDTLFKD